MIPDWNIHVEWDSARACYVAHCDRLPGVEMEGPDAESLEVEMRMAIELAFGLAQKPPNPPLSLN